MDYWYLLPHLQETTGDVLEYLNKEHELEVRELYSITGLEKKEAGLILTQQYMTHFILGIKVITIQSIVPASEFITVSHRP